MRRKLFAAAIVATSITALVVRSAIPFWISIPTRIETKRELINTYTSCQAQCNFQCNVKWLTPPTLNTIIPQGVQWLLAVVHQWN